MTSIPKPLSAFLAVLLGGLFAGLAISGCRAQTPEAPPHAAGIAAPPVGKIAEDRPSPPKPRPPQRRLWICVVGDIMLDRTVGKRIAANGARSILARVRPQTRAPNLTFGNLECPLASTGPHDPYNLCFRADPAAAEVLSDGGFDIVSLANNHTLNAGREGVVETLETLDAHGVAYVGAQRDRERSWEPVFFQQGELTVGFLAYTDLAFEHGSYAKISQNRQRACEQVAQAKRQCELLFVSIHWGGEYERAPRERQRETARALIDAGADCILGHHPHVLQGIGIYKSKPILYSMGNFVFDQREGERMESAVFEIWWREGGVWQIKATPVRIDRGRMGPVYPSEERSMTIAGRLVELSEDLGTRATIQASRVLVRIPQTKAFTPTEGKSGKR